jgi:hypothetical protein
VCLIRVGSVSTDRRLRRRSVNWRSSEWATALEPAGVRIAGSTTHHTFATEPGGEHEHPHDRASDWPERLDGRPDLRHLARDAEEHDRGRLTAFDATDRARGHVVGTENPDGDRGERAAT